MNPTEKLLWSIALPGFGQMLNGKYVKGILLIILEFLINSKANLNIVIFYSFQGEIIKAIEETDYQWLLFYPCLYFFAMWDAWKDAGGGKERYSFLPFVISAYFVTIGCIYSASSIWNFIGPIWLSILCVTPSVMVGLLLKMLINRHYEK